MSRGRLRMARIGALASFPLAKEDVALIVDDEVSSAEVRAALIEGAGELLESVFRLTVDFAVPDLLFHRELAGPLGDERIEWVDTFDADGRFDLITRNHRAGVGGNDFNFDAKVAEARLDKTRGELQGFFGRHVGRWLRRVEQAQRWQLATYHRLGE